MYCSRSLRTLQLGLGIGLGVLAPIVLADPQTTDVKELRKLVDEVFKEANEPFKPAETARLLGATDDSDCETFRKRALREDKSDKTSAAERYEAAVKLQRCLEIKQASLYKKHGPGLAAGAGQAMATEVVTQAMKAQVETAKLIKSDTAGQNGFMGMTFGVGVGVSFSSKAEVTGATVAADNTVRVTDQQKQQPRVILEAHYYGVCEKSFITQCDDGTFGVGPFFGLAATGDTLDAVAFGIMFGWKNKAKTPEVDSGGFSIGIGAVLDKEFQQLAPGFQDGAPLPPGETTVALVKRSKWSPLLFFTKTF